MANATFSPNQLNAIREKAESNTPLSDPTPEKQLAYEQYQRQYIDLITEKANSGQHLSRPNAWKDEIYQSIVSKNQQPQQSQQQQQYTPDAIMERQQGGNADRLASLQQMLQQGANSTYESQKSLLDSALNQQLTDLQNALEQAVADGEMSIRDAHAAFEENKATIQADAYRDSELTQLHAQDRGIQNSQQMVGLMQGDQSRERTMINKNMTERDRRVADVKDRLNMIKNQSKNTMASAQAQHGFGLAGAKGQADAQMYQNMFNMNLEDYKMDRDQRFQLDKSGMELSNQMQLQQQQQKYALEQLTQQQKYTLEQMSRQLGMDLQKMSVDQVYKLAQMAEQQGHNMQLQSSQQNWQGNQNSLDRGHQWNMQGSQQNFQGGQNALDRDHQWNMQGSQQSFQDYQGSLDRDHDLQKQFNSFAHDNNMLTAKQQAEAKAMESAMKTELDSYTNKNSDAYKLRQAQLESSRQALLVEANAKLMADVGGKLITDKIGNPPKHPGNKASKSAIDKYNNEVSNWNSDVTKFFSSETNVNDFIRKIDKAPYNDKQKAATKGFFKDFWNASKSMNPGGLP